MWSCKEYQLSPAANKNKNIPFLRFCLIWGVENCAKLFLKVSWKPRNWKNRSTHQIDWNPIIPHFKHGVPTTFLSITFQILFLEYRYCYFWILQRLGYWKMYRNTFQDVLEVEKWAKQKWILFFKTPCRIIYIFFQFCWEEAERRKKKRTLGGIGR